MKTNKNEPNKDDYTYATGQYIISTYGEYSWYDIGDLYRVIIGFNALEKFKDHEKYCHALYGREKPMYFAEWLQSQGLIDIIEYKECHL